MYQATPDQHLKLSLKLMKKLSNTEAGLKKNVYKKNRLFMKLPLKGDTIGDKTTAIFTCSLTSDNKIEIKISQLRAIMCAVTKLLFLMVKNLLL